MFGILPCVFLLDWQLLTTCEKHSRMLSPYRTFSETQFLFQISSCPAITTSLLTNHGSELFSLPGLKSNIKSCLSIELAVWKADGQLVPFFASRQTEKNYHIQNRLFCFWLCKPEFIQWVEERFTWRGSVIRI